MRLRLLVPAWCAMLALASPAAAQDGAARGAAALRWAQSFACPLPGEPLQIAGLESPARVESTKAENLAYIQSRQQSLDLALRARTQIESEVAQSGGKAGKRLQKAFAELDGKINDLGGDVADSLAQWLMAEYVALSNADVFHNPVTHTPHPLASFVADAERARVAAAPFGPAVLPITDRLFECLGGINQTILSTFEPEILSDVEAARTASAVQEIVNRLELPPLRGSGGLIEQVRSIQLALAEEERRTAERQRAERDAEARRILLAEAERELGIARRYVGFINAGRINDAIALLTPDVVLQSPRGNAQGRQAVAARMRDAAGGGNQANIGAPQIDGNHTIFVTVTANGQSGRMIFGFRDRLIAAIRLVQ
ncbi:nuclear transport factor 2 family protein [Blastomonas aquatica]|uniref:Uncharacterized protein n=2 Tax=Blastomonas aquatica TaxID=1510276 RepID=A0ABQ1JPH7_9SPHN|nr:hypothetical protein GCM10010833_28760 [Blastomonas aquatica]